MSEEVGKCSVSRSIGKRTIRFEKLVRLTARDEFNLRTKRWVGGSAEFRRREKLLQKLDLKNLEVFLDLVPCSLLLKPKLQF